MLCISILIATNSLSAYGHNFLWYGHDFLCGFWILPSCGIHLLANKFYVKSLGFFCRQPEPRQRGLVFLLSPLGMPFALSAYCGDWEREGLMIKLMFSGRKAAAGSRFV